MPTKPKKPRAPASANDADDVFDAEMRQLAAQKRFGARLRTRRNNLPAEDRSLSKVSRYAGWESAENLRLIEQGRTFSRDIEKWLRLADRLDYKRKEFLGDLWDVCPDRGLPIRLPPKGDKRRGAILDWAIELYADHETPELP